MADRPFDLIIVGGGMVGMALACSLGGSRLKVAVIDSHRAAGLWPRADYDIRVSALTRASQHLFEAVGAWDGMVVRRVTPYQRMAVWDASGSGHIDFDAADIGEPDLGHIVENSVILEALLERAAAFDNVELIAPAEVARFDYLPDSVVLTLADGGRLTASLIVGADGTNSWVRDQAGITTSGWSYHQEALVATVRGSLGHRSTAFQRFMPDGPLALLPLPEGYSSVVWSTNPEQAAWLMGLDDVAFLAELQSSFGEAVGTLESVGPRGRFPLALQHANRYVAERVVLVGNAAHAIHPLAGQGLNLGISDVGALAELLVEVGADDCGDQRRLRRYERWRKGDNLTMMAAMDGIKRLFGSDATTLGLLRNLGLNLVDHSGPFKNGIMRRAMGVEGELSKLNRGVPLTG